MCRSNILIYNFRILNYLIAKVKLKNLLQLPRNIMDLLISEFLTIIVYFLYLLNLARVIASGGEDGVINFHNTSLEFISCIEDNDITGYPITSLAFNNNSNFLAYSSTTGFLKIWDLKSSNTELTNKLQNDYFTSLSFNAENTYLAAGSNGGEICNFNMLTNSQTNFKYHSFSRVNIVKYSPFYTNFICSGFEDGSVKVIDNSNCQVVNNFAGFHDDSVSHISLSPINKLFMCSVGYDGKINFYDIISKKHIKSINTEIPLSCISFNIDGQTIAVGNASGSILLYDLRYYNSPKSVIQAHSDGVRYIEFSRKPFTVMNNSLTKSNTSNYANSANKQVDKSFESTSNKDLNNSGTFREKNIPEKVNMNNASNSNVNITNSINKNPNNLNSNTILNNTKPLNESFGNNYNNLNTGSNIQEISIKENFNFSQNDFNLNENLNMSNKTATNKKETKPQINPTSFLKEKDISSIANTNNTNVPHLILNNQTLKLTNQTNKTHNEKLHVEIPSKVNQTPLIKTDLDNKTQDFIKSCIETEMFKMKQYIHDEVNALHVDLIRQFEIQHVYINIYNFRMS